MTRTRLLTATEARQTWEGFGPDDADAPARCQTFERFVADHAPHLVTEATARVAEAFGTVVEVKDSGFEVIANGFGGTTTRRAAPAADAASPKQTAFIRSLLAERSPALVASIRDDLNAARTAGGVSKSQASAAIKALLAIPKAFTPGGVGPAPAAAEAPSAPAAPAKFANKFAGKCHLCGRWVAEQEGLVSKNDAGKWAVEHVACPTSFPFPEGRYAVPTEAGPLGFYHLTEGQVFVQASSDLHLVPAPAADAIVAKIAADPEAASRTYGREIGSCGRCGRTLTNDQSRAEGLGPVCAEKGWG